MFSRKNGAAHRSLRSIVPSVVGIVRQNPGRFYYQGPFFPLLFYHYLFQAFLGGAFLTFP